MFLIKLVERHLNPGKNKSIALSTKMALCSVWSPAESKPPLRQKTQGQQPPPPATPPYTSASLRFRVWDPS